jgi:dTDP-4-amino-4,6-dideoxygalactose transaminase
MNPYRSIKDFEEALCDYTGAPNAVVVESCTAALFLCCVREEVKNLNEITIPSYTYPGVANSIVHAGGRIKFVGYDWQANRWPAYSLSPTRIIDSAKALWRGMYRDIKNFSAHKKPLVCLSFHSHKSIPIGRGGAILISDREDVEWLKCAQFDGRHEKPLHADSLAFPGWNMYMTPEQASRGLELMQWLPDEVLCERDPYQDLSKYEFYVGANR